MNQYFKTEVIEQYYPEAGSLMYPSMLCWKLPPNKVNMLSEICSKGDYFLQEKIDGIWYQFVKTENFSYLFGRNVSKKSNGVLTEKSKNIPHIVNAFSVLPANTIIIGEIYVPGGTSRDATRIMGCLPEEAIKRQEEEGLVKYYCHDIIFYDGVNLLQVEAERRYDILKAIWRLHSFDSYDFLRLAVKVETDLEETLSRILREGGEGVVLKKKTAPYSPDKRPAWHTIKVKQMDSIDLVITRTIEPTKEYTGKDIKTWPYWENEEGVLSAECHYNDEGWIAVTKPYYLGWHTALGIGAYDENGDLIELGTVSSGLTDSDRKAMSKTPESYVGSVCSIDCMSIDKEGHTLRHPVFKEMRPDKNPRECQINEIF